MKRKILFILTMLSFLCCLVGSILGAVDLIAEYRASIKYKDSAISVQATVTEIKSTYDIDTGQWYDVYITYKYNGKEYNEKYAHTGIEPEYEVGETLEILINPDEPSSRIISIGEIIFLGIIDCVLMFLAVSSIFSVLRVNEENKAEFLIEDMKHDGSEEG